MKLLIVAVGLIALGATSASAQRAGGWNQSEHPYAQRNHGVCQSKAMQLHNFERRASADGRVSRSERATIASLQRDLNRTCGGFRHRG
jgi:hypothetical protein